MNVDTRTIENFLNDDEVEILEQFIMTSCDPWENWNPGDTPSGQVLSGWYYGFDFYNEKTFVHINVDDIIAGIPQYKKQIDEISNYLITNVLNKKFNEYANRSLHKYGDKTISDLKDNLFMATLDADDYRKIYNEIFEPKYLSF